MTVNHMIQKLEILKSLGFGELEVKVPHINPETYDFEYNDIQIILETYENNVAQHVNLWME